MGNTVGIDLGTTNSVGAFKLADVEVVTAPDNTPPERKLTRSVVAFAQNQLVVGEEAYRQLKAEPENVIVSIKRLIGRGFGDAVVQKHLSRFGYRVTQSTQGTENSMSVWLGGKEYTPEDISAEILKKVLQNAQNYQSQRGQRSAISEAVITVPAYFNDQQRHATQIAAQIAGLSTTELLPEPTAAAISYGFKPDADNAQTILVYDFGGGTFDSCVITTTGSEFIEVGKAGDLWLGGDDIDNRITQFVKQQVAAEEGLEDVDKLVAQMPHYQRVRFLGDLKMAVERAKVELSSANSARIMPSTPLLDDLGMAVAIDVEITREQFEQMILPFVERSVAVCQEAIKDSDHPADMINVVLLVGGSSQIPLVQRLVREAFGADKVVVHPRPMYAVAEGAAIVAAGLTEKVMTVSRDYFIELVDEPRHKLVEKGDVLPVKKARTFRTEADGQRLIHFKFYSPDQVSESLDKTKRDERIGEMWLALDQPYPQGTEVLVTAELDEKNSSLQITAALKNNPSIRVSCSFSRGGEDEKIAQQVEQIIQDLNQEGQLTEKGVQEAYTLAGEAVDAANQTRNQNGQVQADRLDFAQEKLKELERFASEDYHLAQSYLSAFEFVLEECDFLLPDAQQQRIRSLCSQLEEAIATNNLSAIQKLSEDAQRELKNLPEPVKLILMCKDAISRAYQVAPTQANAMASKLSQIVAALKRQDGYEAERLFQELLVDMRP
ncbi:MAG: Hsp70 family protein, partial [Cyanophyceae cyanobacterium]